MSVQTFEYDPDRLIEDSLRDDPLHGELMPLNMGPQHPATHGVLRLVLELDGERINRCIPHIGYLHTGFEKTCEFREWNQVVPYTDRMDYLAPMLYNIGYAGAVETLLGVEITERCRVVRIAVQGKMIGPQRVDDDDDDVRSTPRRSQHEE